MVLTARKTLKNKPANLLESAERMNEKTVEIPRSDHFNIKNVGIQTNTPLSWHDSRYTY